jgi:hypothetical protein
MRRAPGVGVGRMVVTSIASFLLLWGAGYQPRHRTKRETGTGRLARRRREEDPLSTGADQPAEHRWPTQTPWMPSPPAAARWTPSPPATACWMPSPSTQPSWRPSLWAETSWPPGPTTEPEFPDRFENDRLRDMLEDFPLDELTRIIPEIVQRVVHSSANTVMTAWDDFREATWNNLQEDAVVIRLGRAHEAWWLITNGPLHQASGGP